MSSRIPLAAAAALLLAALPVGCLVAAGREERTFAVLVDGKPAGTHRLAWQEEDGVETVTAATDVRVHFLALPYSYSLRSSETWRGGRLVSLVASANDNGTRAEVKAATGAGGLTLTAGGKSRALPADTLTTTGARPPAGASLVDVEDGSVTAVRVEGPLPGRVNTAAGPIAADRYRLAGPGVESEWWFDAAGRPVRQEMKWEGRHVTLELTGVSR